MTDGGSAARDQLGHRPPDVLVAGDTGAASGAEELPPEISELIRTSTDDEQRRHGLSYLDIDLFRERLMPEDPADLWTAGPDIARAADWWLAFKGSAGR